MTNIHDKATRQSLINRYMEAETSPAEERMLADYFLAGDTVDEDEQAFAELIRVERSNASLLSHEGVEEYDKMVGKAPSSSRTLSLRWMALIGSIAACLILIFSLRSSPKESGGLELAQSLYQIMDLPLREITSLTATPIGEYVWIKAQFADGTEETFIMERDEETNIMSLLVIPKEPQKPF